MKVGGDRSRLWKCRFMESPENDETVFRPFHRPWKSIKPIPTFPPPRPPRGEIKSSKPAQLRATHSEGKVMSLMKAHCSSYATGPKDWDL